MSASAQIELTGIRKAAILLSLLGDSVASSICDHLPKESLRALNDELSSLGEIPDETANLVLKEYEQMSGQKVPTVQTARKPVEKPLPKPAEMGVPSETCRPAEIIGMSRPAAPRSEVREATAPVKISPEILRTLRAATPERLAQALQTELPQTIALILVHVDGRAGRTALDLLPEESRAQAVRRLAQMKASSPEIVNRILTAFTRKLSAVPAADAFRREPGSANAVTGLLNQTQVNRTRDKAPASTRSFTEKEITALGASLRSPMFTFDDFIEIPDAAIRELLPYVDKKTLATAMKTTSEALRTHFLKCMPPRAAQMLKEDAEILGNLRARDIARAESGNRGHRAQPRSRRQARFAQSFKEENG